MNNRIVLYPPSDTNCVVCNSRPSIKLVVDGQECFSTAMCERCLLQIPKFIEILKNTPEAKCAGCIVDNNNLDGKLIYQELTGYTADQIRTPHCSYFRTIEPSDNPSDGEANCDGDGHYECGSCYYLKSNED